ncbi:MAG: hypothetical protein IJ564_03685, partial [Alphaproteobacteria bacterium]|nr:hypothetical protein [Alphaproteobacteria bacterium]
MTFMFYIKRKKQAFTACRMQKKMLTSQFTSLAIPHEFASKFFPYNFDRFQFQTHIYNKPDKILSKQHFLLLLTF